MTMIEKVARAICKTHGAFDPDALRNGITRCLKHQNMSLRSCRCASRC